jgi:hypothetical protein
MIPLHKHKRLDFLEKNFVENQTSRIGFPSSLPGGRKKLWILSAENAARQCPASASEFG